MNALNLTSSLDDDDPAEESTQQSAPLTPQALRASVEKASLAHDALATAAARLQRVVLDRREALSKVLDRRAEIAEEMRATITSTATTTPSYASSSTATSFSSSVLPPALASKVSPHIPEALSERLRAIQRDVGRLHRMEQTARKELETTEAKLTVAEQEMMAALSRKQTLSLELSAAFARQPAAESEACRGEGGSSSTMTATPPPPADFDLGAALLSFFSGGNSEPTPTGGVVNDDDDVLYLF